MRSILEPACLSQLLSFNLGYLLNCSLGESGGLRKQAKANQAEIKIGHPLKFERTIASEPR